MNTATTGTAMTRPLATGATRERRLRRRDGRATAARASADGRFIVKIAAAPIPEAATAPRDSSRTRGTRPRVMRPPARQPIAPAAIAVASRRSTVTSQSSARSTLIDARTRAPGPSQASAGSMRASPARPAVTSAAPRKAAMSRGAFRPAALPGTRMSNRTPPASASSTIPRTRGDMEELRCERGAAPAWSETAGYAGVWRLARHARVREGPLVRRNETQTAS